LLAAGAHGREAIDGVFLDVTDAEGLAAEAADAVAMGFAAKASIHPSQVPVIRDAFRPGADAVAWAREVVDAVASGGVATVRGRMVDEPLLRQAKTLLAAAAVKEAK
jgi:citrate lyase subunit beta/citryl-CoA lyase